MFKSYGRALRPLTEISSDAIEIFTKAFMNTRNVIMNVTKIICHGRDLVIEEASVEVNIFKPHKLGSLGPFQKIVL